MERAEAWLLQTAGSPLTFVVVIVVLAVGVVVVFLPSESLVVAVAALLLARPDRDLRLAVLVVASALGLAAGDLLLYALARRLSRRTRPALAGSGLAGRFRRRLEARTTTLRARFSANPWTAMVFARLVPAGRASSDVIAADLGCRSGGSPPTRWSAGSSTGCGVVRRDRRPGLPARPAPPPRVDRRCDRPGGAADLGGRPRRHGPGATTRRSEGHAATGAADPGYGPWSIR